MTLMIVGLIVFLGVHSTRIVADPWRTAQIARIGERPWKGIYALLSLAGFVLIVWGYGQARMSPIPLYAPPVWTRHLAALLTLPAFILIVSAYVPGTHMKARIGHPMVAGVKLWALSHLIANGNLADVVLFGAFLVWAILDFIVSRRRDRIAGTVYPPGTAAGDVKAVAIGTMAWVVFAFWLHGALIGVRPFG